MAQEGEEANHLSLFLAVSALLVPFLPPSPAPAHTHTHTDEGGGGNGGGDRPAGFGVAAVAVAVEVISEGNSRNQALQIFQRWPPLVYYI